MTRWIKLLVAVAALGLLAWLVLRPAKQAAPSRPDRDGADPAPVGHSLDSVAEEVLRPVGSGPVRGYVSRDFGRDRFPVGRSVLVPESVAREALLGVRERLPPGYIAFLGTDRFLGDDRAAPGMRELCLIQSDDPLDAVRAAATEPVNHGLTTEDVVARLQEWQDRYGMDVLGASTEHVEFVWNLPPSEAGRVAAEIEEFCPDAIYQGYIDVHTVEAYAVRLLERPSVYLWWD